jgi:hypothetical protein
MLLDTATMYEDDPHGTFERPCFIRPVLINLKKRVSIYDRVPS